MGYERIGGHPVLDLVNTVSWRGDPTRTVDHLPGLGGLVGWAEATGVLDPGEAAEVRRLGAGDGVPEEVAALREDWHRVLAAVADGVAPPAEASAAVSAAAVDGYRAADLVPMAGSAAWGWVDRTVSPRLPVHRLARAAADLLRSDDLRLVRRCGGPACDWLFLDRSRNRSRRWCSPTDCGNRVRVRRHYARQSRARQARVGGQV